MDNKDQVINALAKDLVDLAFLVASLKNKVNVQFEAIDDFKLAVSMSEEIIKTFVKENKEEVKENESKVE